jgi:nitrogen-specific signal transduction histidine kinase
MLISEILQRSILQEEIQKSHWEREKMALEVCHICRNRFLSIGGFARKLTQALQDPALRRRVGIILDEVEKVERALDERRNSQAPTEFRREDP